MPTFHCPVGGVYTAERDIALCLGPLGDASIACQVTDGTVRPESASYFCHRAIPQVHPRHNRIRCPLPGSRYVISTRGAQQSWLVNDMHLIATGRLQAKIRRIRHVFSPHIRAKLDPETKCSVKRSCLYRLKRHLRRLTMITPF